MGFPNIAGVHKPLHQCFPEGGGGHMEWVLPSFHDIFTPSPIKFNVILNGPPSSLKSKAPFQEMIPRKKNRKHH